jgi:hypothetical protein
MDSNPKHHGKQYQLRLVETVTRMTRRGQCYIKNPPEGEKKTTKESSW